MCSAVAAHAAKKTWTQEFSQASDEYFDQVYFPYAPTGGTLVGYHQYDAQLEDFSRKNIDAEIAALKRFEKRIEAIHPDDSTANFVPRSDREMVLANIHSTLLTLENDSSLGKECGQLFEHLREWCVCADGAQVRFAGRSAAVAGRARKADACAAQ